MQHIVIVYRVDFDACVSGKNRRVRCGQFEVNSEAEAIGFATTLGEHTHGVYHGEAAVKVWKPEGSSAILTHADVHRLIDDFDKPSSGRPSFETPSEQGNAKHRLEVI